MRNWIRWCSPKILTKIPGNYIRRELARWPLTREPDHCQIYLIALPWYSWLVDVETEKDTTVSWVLTRLSFAFSSAPGITSLDNSSHCQRNPAPSMKGALFSKIRMAQNAYECQRSNLLNLFHWIHQFQSRKDQIKAFSACTYLLHVCFSQGNGYQVRKCSK